MLDKGSLLRLFSFKRWADTETLNVVQKIDATVSPQQHHQMLRLMNHIYVVDMIFRANLTGQDHGYTALNTPETPSAETLKAALRDCADWYQGFIRDLPVDSGEQVISFRFVDGGDGQMRLIDMLNHVLFHGAYHRGVVGWLISGCGETAPKDVLTVFLRDHQGTE